MIQLPIYPDLQLGINSFPIETYLLEEFKDFLDDLIRNSDLAKSFKPRLYRYSDFLLVKLYATLTNSTVEVASEYLNIKLKRTLIKKGLFKEKEYRDNIRKRRVITHQTEVDKFFRRMSKNDVK